MSRLLKSSKSLETDNAVSNYRFRRLRLAIAPRLEMVIFKWICAQNNAGHQINGSIVKFYAEQLLKETNTYLPSAGQITLNFSEGWLSLFQKRFSFMFRRVHGEALFSNGYAIAAHMPRLTRLIFTFASQDVWNAGKLGLFYT